MDIGNLTCFSVLLNMGLKGEGVCIEIFYL